MASTSVISLSDDNKQWAEEQSVARGFVSVSAFVEFVLLQERSRRMRDAINLDQQLQDRISP